MVKPNSAAKREVRWEPNPVGPARALPSTREATVWSPGPRSSCISWRVFFTSDAGMTGVLQRMRMNITKKKAFYWDLFDLLQQQ